MGVSYHSRARVRRMPEEQGPIENNAFGVITQLFVGEDAAPEPNESKA